MTQSFNKHRHSEEAFLFASFNEFVKCWSSGKRSRLFIESVNGHAFVNFSAFLGYPKDDHFMPKARDRQSKPKKKKKQKSQRKIQRDNARAAEFQERKRRERERALISLPDISFMTGEGASLGNPNNPMTSSPSTAGAAPAPSFHFSKPRPENVRDSSETLMHTSLYFSRIEEETQSRLVESSSITDHHPVTREEEPVLETEVSGEMDKTAAVEEEDCPEDEEGAAAEGAAITQGQQIDMLYLETKKLFEKLGLMP